MSRACITSPTTFYVNNVTGDDANDGLSAATAWRTIQYAVNKLQRDYDFAAQPTIQLCTTGVVYAEAVVLARYIGSLGYVKNAGVSTYIYPKIQGDPANNISVCVYPSSGAPFTSVNGDPWIIDSIRVCANSTYGIVSDAHAHLLLHNMNFAVCGAGHMIAEYGGFIETLAGPYTISEGAPWHISAVMRGEWVSQGNAVSFTAPYGAWPNFTCFARGDTGGLVNMGQLSLVSGGHTTGYPNTPNNDGTALMYPMAGGSWG